MPVDDGGVTGSGGINGEVIDVVDVEDANLANFQCSGVREPLSPNPSVDIAPNCHIRSNLRQFVQDLWLAYITCMDDQFRTLKSFDGFGTQQPVCIRNDANDVGLVHALGLYDSWRESYQKRTASPTPVPACPFSGSNSLIR